MPRPTVTGGRACRSKTWQDGRPHFADPEKGFEFSYPLGCRNHRCLAKYILRYLYRSVWIHLITLYLYPQGGSGNKASVLSAAKWIFEDGRKIRKGQSIQAMNETFSRGDWGANSRRRLFDLDGPTPGGAGRQVAGGRGGEKQRGGGLLVGSRTGTDRPVILLSSP